MPEDKLNFAPSKGLAALEGIFKGISDVYKRKKEEEAKRIQSESTLFRQLWPTLFQEQGRQRRFEQEQKLGFLRFGAEREEAQQTLALKLRDMDLAVEDLKLKRENYEKTWEMDKDKFEYSKQQDYMQNAIDLLGQSTQVIIAHANNMTTLAAQGTFEQKQDGLKSLEELQFEHNRLIEQLKQTYQASEAGLRRTFEEQQAELGRVFQRGMAGEATVDRQVSAWRNDLFDLYNSYIWTSFTEDPNNDELATAAKNAIATLEARRMAIPADKRPAASELPAIKESGKRRWFIIPDSFKREVVPRTEGAPAPVSIDEINTIKNMDAAEKQSAYDELYPRLKAMGKSDKEIATIKSYIFGIKQ